MNKLNENLSEILEIEPIKTQVPAVKVIDDKSEDDFETAKNTIRNMMAKGEEVLEDLVQVAKETESPRAYEVAANLIKTVTEAAKDMVEVHKHIGDIKKDRGEPEKKIGGNINVEQAVFVGSTTELQALIKERRKAIND